MNTGTKIRNNYPMNEQRVIRKLKNLMNHTKTLQIKGLNIASVFAISIMLTAFGGFFVGRTALAAECPTVTVENSVYHLEPCSITAEMVDGAGDKPFQVTIVQEGEQRLYSFSVYGYGNGLPTYAIIGNSSGGVQGGRWTLNENFKDSVLDSENGQAKVYTGYLPIWIYHGSWNGVYQELKLNINLTVTPAPQPVALSGIEPVEVTATGAKIKWVADQQLSGKVVYSTTESVDTSQQGVAGVLQSPGGKYLYHAVLSGLTPRTTYYYKIVVDDPTVSGGKRVFEGDYSYLRRFGTLAETVDYNPRIQYWYGKVNQHVENGIWKTDPDGSSGANLDKLTYCKKFYPQTTRIEDYRYETIFDYKAAGNAGIYIGTHLTTRCIDETPRIAYWYGKVNQHVENGVWKTDPDGVSGADLDKLTYCKKFYPQTTSVAEYIKETIFDWKERGNVNSHVKDTISYRCVAGGAQGKPDLVITDVQILGTPRVGDGFLSGYAFIKNQGTAPAVFQANTTSGGMPSVWVLAVAVSGAVDDGGTKVALSGPAAGGDQGSTLQPGETKQYSFSTYQDVTTKRMVLGSRGESVLYFKVDPDNVVSESNESNNNTTKTIIIQAAMNVTPLSCGALEADSDANKYFGVCKSEGFDYVCFNKFSGAYQGCTKTLGEGCTSSNINADENISCKSDIAQKADLIIESISDPMPNTIRGGWDIAVYFNQYWPSGTTFKNFDVELRNLTTGKSMSTTVGSSVKRNVDFSIDWSPGTYQLEAKVDSFLLNQVEESNENNNVATKTVTVKPVGSYTGDGTYELAMGERVKVNNGVTVKVATILTDAVGYKVAFDMIDASSKNVKTTGYLTASLQPYIFDASGVIITVSSIGYNGTRNVVKATLASTGAVSLAISNTTLTDVTENLARFTWQTNKPASGFVYYRASDSNNYSWQGYDDLKTGHSVILPTLQPATRYYYYVSVKDAEGNIARTDESSFVTLTHTNGSLTGNITGGGHTVVGRIAKIQWRTDGTYNCSIVFKGRPDISDDVISPGAGISIAYAGEQSSLDVDLGALSLPNRESDRLVYYKIVCRDRTDGHKVAESDVNTIELPAVTTVRPPISSTVTPVQNDPDVAANEEVRALRERIKRLELRISELEKEVVERERRLTARINQELSERLKGRILLQVEGKGEAWYVDPISEERFYLKDGNTAYQALQAFGLGIRNDDLERIPIGIEERALDVDADSDGLSDKLEEAIGTSPSQPDSDGDGYPDGREVRLGYSPLEPSSDKLSISSKLAERLEGRIILQVESRGQAWYIHNGKRYYMRDGDLAYQIMRFLSLGIKNNDLRKIQVGEFE